MDIVIDTNFIITSLKQKIKLFEDIENEFPECRIFVPLEVIDELNKVKEDKKNTREDREIAELAIFMIKKFNPYMEPFGTKNVDAGILKHIVNNQDTIIATLDRDLKAKIKTKVKSAKFLTIVQKKLIRLE